ncbi:MAG: SDR family oxidoreductase [Geminicoccaceae bacterium]|nr:MAG: SDR family oxidoreductase [Geminicoccaceae bacterium]
MSGRLAGKVALVTGAARGIGEAIVRAFKAEGASVVATDLHRDGVQHLAQSLAPRVRAAGLDVREPSDWSEAMAELLATEGRLDVLVNNAGISGFEDGIVAHDPEHASLEDWHAVLRTNLDGVFLGCRAAIRAMRPQGTGSIINIASRSGNVGIAGAAAYAASKAAVRNHTKTVALWCAEQGLAIRCNSIHPAAVLTPMWEPLFGDGPDRAERMAAFAATTPLKRFGRPDEVAALAILLASDEATYMTGTELHLDGGLLAGAEAAPRTE